MRRGQLGIGIAVSVVLFLAGCSGGSAESAQAPLPTDDYFDQARSRAVPLEAWPATVERSTCRGISFVWLPFRSAWVLAAPLAAGSCQVWLGGETENPSSDGRPTQFCYLGEDELPVPILIGEGGPASIDHPNCRDIP